MIDQKIWQAELQLDLDTILFNWFGGWSVRKDGELYYKDENPSFIQGDPIQLLVEIEQEAKKDPDHDWRAVLYLPLRGATYQRHGDDMWKLIEINRGFV